MGASQSCNESKEAILVLEDFKEYLRSLGRSDNTVTTYCRDVGPFLSWFRDSFGEEPQLLYRANILEYISYMRNLQNYNPRT